ncbi:helix-turn-helix domain-containing protein [Paenibacillus sp. MZ04-78.2]|uniref:helix-turn-helix domain-containing protein n=1 Tax=Paenibacillus sp. MZ04-78.2 TaxID=2962034 RepID=UPI0035CBC14E
MAYSRGRCLLPDWLEKLGLSQAEYSRRSGRSKRVISHFCNDARVMLPEDLYTASKLLGCKMEDLYEWIEH